MHGIIISMPMLVSIMTFILIQGHSGIFSVEVSHIKTHKRLKMNVSKYELDKRKCDFSANFAFDFEQNDDGIVHGRRDEQKHCSQDVTKPEIPPRWPCG